MSKVNLENFFFDAENEVQRSVELHGDFSGSLHEAYGIMLEEFDEFWDEVKMKQHDPVKLYDELVQIAAMAAKTATSCLTFGE